MMTFFVVMSKELVLVLHRYFLRVTSFYLFHTVDISFPSSFCHMAHKFPHMGGYEHSRQAVLL